MATCNICGNEVGPITVGRQTTLCAECQYKTEEAPAALIPEISPDSRPSSLTKRPSVTTILVGLNIAVFVRMVVSNLSSLWQPTSGELIRWGADWGPLTLGSQPWRLLTSNYVHIGIIHLFFNMWCLLNLGKLAERILDRKTYLLIYTLCGLVGSCISAWWHPQVVGAGASGAIFGLAGALLAALYLGKFPGKPRRHSSDAEEPTRFCGLESVLRPASWSRQFRSHRRSARRSLPGFGLLQIPERGRRPSQRRAQLHRDRWRSALTHSRSRTSSRIQISRARCGLPTAILRRN